MLDPHVPRSLTLGAWKTGLELGNWVSACIPPTLSQAWRASKLESEAVVDIGLLLRMFDEPRVSDPRPKPTSWVWN